MLDAVADVVSDGPSGGDASAPTVSLVTPNIGSSAGGWKLTVTGSNYVNGAVITIDGNACSSVMWVNSTTLTAIAPAYSSANGSTTGQSVTVTNPDLESGTGSGTPGSYFYLPSNKPIVMFQRGDVGVTGGSSVTGWADQSGNGNNWSQFATAAQPGTGMNYNFTSLSYLTLNGTAQFMTNTFASPITNGVATMFVVGNFTGTNSNVGSAMQGASSSADITTIQSILKATSNTP